MATFKIATQLPITRPIELTTLSPFEQVQQKFAERSDETPVLLLPIRMETRFMTIKHVYREVGTSTQGKPAIPDTKELWVRFFPDDLAISSHESDLTQYEVDAAKSYWEQVYTAGGKETNLLGSWRVVANALGAPRAAYVIKVMTPTNYVATTKTFSGAPAYPSPNIKTENWTVPASCFVMPDRFVAVGYRGTATKTVVGKVLPDVLHVGLAPTETTFVQESASLTLPDGLKWMTDFKEAERIGMALRFKLEGDWQSGMTRLVVVGLMLGNSADVSQDLLTELVGHQRFTSGFAFVKQGTPTNNTEQVNSGLDATALSADVAFANERGAAKVVYVADSKLRTDGQWFADAMGLEYDTVAYLDNAGGKDIAEAMAMNRAMWPATLQFGMRQMMHPLFSDSVIANTEKFFKAWVTGRGQIPAFRVGNQPYGVVPATAFSRWEYKSTDLAHSFHKNLLPVLQSMNEQWDTLATKVKTVTGTSISSLDSKFMEIIGLHPSSVTFYQRFAAGPDVLYGLESFYTSLTGTVYATQKNSVDGLDSLNSTGLGLTAEPFAASVVTPDANRRLTGPVIDTLPLSETEPIQPLQGSTKNYLNWLVNATHASLRIQNFSNVQADADCPTPKALLYLFLRHSLLLEYANTAFDLLLANGLVTTSDRFLEDFTGVSTRTMTLVEKSALRTKVENDILKLNGYVVADTGTLTLKLAPTTTLTRSTEIAKYATEVESEYTRQVKVIEQGAVIWADTEAMVPQVSSTLGIGAYIDSLAITNSTKAALKEVRDALSMLEKVPTARLERALAEHLDLCSYRLDAWKNGLIQERLIGHRQVTGTRKKGIHLGAYGWLESLSPGTLPGIDVKEAVRKSGKSLTSTLVTDFDIVEASPFDATSKFTYLGTDTTVPLVLDAEARLVRPAPRTDVSNQGYIHTPSINHAAAAAILRAGYKSDPTDAMAVNLNSARVRTALFYMEGVRNGQELGALLGYRYERGMHDLGLKDSAGAYISLESYLVQMRSAYPLVAGSVVATGSGSVQSSEARNVMDGLKAVETYRNEGETGFLAKITVTDLTVKAALVLLIQQLSDELDALGDLSLAEAVYQLAHGRKERADAVMRAANGEGTFPDIELVNTPRTGKSLTHRVALHLDGPNPKHNYWTATSLLANCEPRLNPFVGQHIGDPTKICFNVTLEVKDEAGMTSTLRCKVKLDDLGLQPLHFLLLVGRQLDQPDATALNQRIAYAARTKYLLRDDGTLQVSFADRTGFNADDKSLIEVIAHLEALLDVLRRTRHLRPEDLLLPGQTAPTTGGYDIAELKGRLTDIRAGTTPYGALYALKTAQTAVSTAANNLRAGFTTTRMNSLRSKLMDVHPLNIQGTIPVSMASNAATDATDLLAQADEVVVRLQTLYDTARAQYTVAIALADEEACIKALQDVAKTLFGKDFLLLPTFMQRDATTFAAAKTYADGPGLLSSGGDFPVEEWLQGISRVRPAMSDFLRASVMSEAVHGQDRMPALRPLQLPHTLDNIGNANARWVGIAFPDTYEVPGDVLSLVSAFPTGYTATAVQVGLVLDEWSEVIPNKTENTGLAMHMNQPNSRPPQSLLLCVTPKETGAWSWDNLLAIVNETLDAAKQRAVDPNIIDTSVYAQYLPMLYASLTAPAGFPTLDFARNISPTFKGIFSSLPVTESSTLLNNLKLMD